MSYRPKYKQTSGSLVDLPLDAETVKGEDVVASLAKTVRFEEQTLTDEQQEQARENIGALGADDIKINLNGSSVSNPSFYAPTTSGTAGQVLKSMGAGQAPVWANESVDIGGAVVTLGASLTYNGQEQTQTVTSVVLNGIPLEQGQDYTVTGNKATNAGTYSLTITGINDYKGAIGVEWVLNKAQSTISVQPTEMTIFGAAGTTQTATITYNGGGGISVQTGSASIATADRSGNTITVTSVGNGNTTITISTIADQNWLAASCEIDVAVIMISSILNENTWAKIKATADQDLGANYWEVGDTKQITINGTVGEKAMNNYSTWVYIIGFNHNAPREGNHLIHFQGFKTAQTSDTSICLVDSHYNDSSTNGSNWFNMNHSGHNNSGGWKGCDLRYDILGSTDVNNGDPSDTCTSSPVADTLMAALESDLRAVMQPVTKYTDNTGGGSNTASYVTATKDYLWLLSEYEVQGSRTFANSAEQNYQEQYAYYANGNSKVKYRDTGTGSAAKWWCRSPVSSNYARFIGITTGGGINDENAGNSFGLAPAFAA